MTAEESTPSMEEAWGIPPAEVLLVTDLKVAATMGVGPEGMSPAVVLVATVRIQGKPDPRRVALAFFEEEAVFAVASMMKAGARLWGEEEE